jgi:putative acetyltransferase
MTIRPGTLEDREAIFQVHLRAIRASAGGWYPPAVIAAWTGSLSPLAYTAVVAAGQLFVAEQDGDVVGFGQLDPATGGIDAIYVRPDAQRRGVGLRLLAEAERRARRAGHQVVHLSASLNAVAFYARAGFASAGRSRHPLSSGVTMTCELMTRVIARQLDDE